MTRFEFAARAVARQWAVAWMPLPPPPEGARDD
jgi:hypothetical protein